MPTTASYGEYIAGQFLLDQRKYRQKMRESDRVLIDMARRSVEGKLKAGGRASLIDVGCAKGNLLYHLKRAMGDLEVVGADVYPGVIEHCRADPDLSGIEFEAMDLLDMTCSRQFDVAVVNAVLFLFNGDEFETAVRNLAAIIADGGALLGYDLFHPFEQHLTMSEISRDHPEGMTLNFRPFATVEEVLGRHGFSEISFEPFDIPIDLPRSSDPADITSYTVREQSGRRLIFRGTLLTPWCHFVARRV